MHTISAKLFSYLSNYDKMLLVNIRKGSIMIERRKIKITDLIINPYNARFVNPIDEYNEKFAIEALCNDKYNHMDLMVSDIAINNLNPNELPIIMPSEVYEGKYEVMDGNRRVTCIKLLLQYKNSIDKFKIPKLVINAVKNAKTINVNELIECVYSDNEAYINDLLEKLHTHKTGISTVEWEPIAQERHNYKKGELSKVNVLVRFLETSKYSNENIANNLNKYGWVRKFERFIGNSKTARNYFGFEFSKDLDKIIMYYNEQEIVKGLDQLLQDSVEMKASEFAQKEENRNEYLNKFEQQNIIDKSKINDPVLAYYISDGHISATTMNPLQSTIININDNINKKEENNSDIQKAKSKGIEKKDLIIVENQIETKEHGKEDNDINKSKFAGKDHQSRGKSHKNNTTESRLCLIPRNISYIVTDQRTVDLLEELQSTPIKGHRNLVAIGFRSFIEFSVIMFIEKYSNNYNENGKNLIDKIRYTVSKLEATYGQNSLKKVIPSIYQLLNTTCDKTSHFGDISMFNLFVHYHKFHPKEDDLKLIYNNYEPYIKLLWDEINKK